MTSKHTISDIIPREVVESWLRGEYLIGDRESFGYEYIGWSLMLRGFYCYETKDKSSRRTHWGYCFIDLKDRELEYAGVRLWTWPEWSDFRNLYHPIYWRSVFSKIAEVGNTPHLFFAYVVHKITDGFSKHSENLDLTASDRARLQAMDTTWNEIRKSANIENFPEDHNSLPKQTVKKIVEYLGDRSQFDADIQLLDRVSTPNEVLALLDLEIGKPEKIPFKFEGKYRTLAPLSLSGTQFYTRVQVK